MKKYNGDDLIYKKKNCLNELILSKKYENIFTSVDLSATGEEEIEDERKVKLKF